MGAGAAGVGAGGVGLCAAGASIAGGAKVARGTAAALDGGRLAWAGGSAVGSPSDPPVTAAPPRLAGPLG